ncbi:hypothetical protein ACVRW7_05340 [Streptococcus ratti]|uniref:Transposase n=1 Tax=Streptococcus ratti FA-1 = DSM 20564 TaxID=699248 RepID=A0ABP2R068_STRRT|nr:hypothetical protein [Streptococcus ratti]EJN94668.1 hypothetical protein SRA_09041 [Streptococcus ratti FA-1 = DSM 20564]EMP70230.1 hypothetical protein D822_05105 [Streptococcus ratti FA-1 = DSM 20564]VEI60936.1 Uncharacterised protein [Streptococcus mutans]
MGKKKELPREEELFLKAYKEKSCHHFRDILTYVSILDKLTNK